MSDLTWPQLRELRRSDDTPGPVSYEEACRMADANTYEASAARIPDRLL